MSTLGRAPRRFLIDGLSAIGELSLKSCPPPLLRKSRMRASPCMFVTQPPPPPCQMPRLLLLAGLLAACCGTPQRVTFGGAAQRTNTRLRFRQQAQGGDTTATRIGLVGDQLGSLDPVPGSDYESRVDNTNRRPQTNQGLRQPTGSGQFRQGFVCFG